MLCGERHSAELSGPEYIYIQRLGCNMSRVAIEKKIREISAFVKMSHLVRVFIAGQSDLLTSILLTGAAAILPFSNPSASL